MKHVIYSAFLVCLSACATDAPAPVDKADTGADTEQQDAQALSDDTATVQDAATTQDTATEDAATARDAASEDVATEDVTTVDAASEDGGGDTSAPAPAGETCDDAIDVTAGGTFSLDTTNAVDDYSSPISAPGCPSGAISGPDHAFLLAPTVATTYRVRVEPVGNFDPFLYVREDCDANACMEGTVLNGPGVAENITVTVPADAAYFVIVDGEGLSSGSDRGQYTLTVTIQ